MHLIFDLDNTLARIHINWQLMKQHLVSHLNLPDNYTSLKFWQICDKVGSDTFLPTYTSLEYKHLLQSGYTLFTFTPPLLHQLSQKHQLSLLTSNASKTAYHILQTSNIIHYFTYLFPRDSVKKSKPHTEHLQHALNTIKSTDVLYIGDNPINDWQMAEKLGIPCLKIGRGENFTSRLLNLLKNYE